jgi:mannosyltransferase
MRAADGQFIAYYAFLHVWTSIGNSEAVLRAPSVLAALVALGATYALGHVLFGRWVAVIGTALLGANPLFISLAREARPYSFAIACVTLSSLLFVIANDGNRPRAWIGYAVAAVAAVYAHLFAVLAVLAHAVYAVAAPGRAHLRRLGLATVAFAAAIVPIVWIAFEGDLHHLDWIPRTMPGVIAAEAVSFCGSPELVAIDGALLIGAALATRRAFTAGDRFLWCWLLVPTILTVALSFARPMLVARYLSIVLPALCLLAARGATAIRWMPATIATAAIVVALCAASVRSDSGPVEDWRGAVASVLDQRDPRDALVIVPADVEVPVIYYLKKPVSGGPQIYYPADSPLQRMPPPIGDIDVARLAAEHARLWLVLRSAEIDGPVRRLTEQIAGSYELREQERFPGVIVLLWTSRG